MTLSLLGLRLQFQNLQRFLTVTLTLLLVIPTLCCFPLSTALGHAPKQDEAVELELAVRQMNAWLAGDDQAEGWRRYLMLNALDTQAAKGVHADLAVLGEIKSRFDSDVDGLDHPKFKRVGNAVDDLIAMLVASRSKSMEQWLAEARGDYRSISIDAMQAQRDRTLAEIDRMVAYYRTTMPSRDRALLFYDLEIDNLRSTLESIEFELPPEISAGKLNSMIRDLRLQRRGVTDKLDAMPLRREPEQNQQDPQQDRPIEDEQERSRRELEQKRDSLTEEINQLNTRMMEIRRADAPRQRYRAQTFRELLRMERNFLEASKSQGDPYFVGAASEYEAFVRLYFYGTDDNLQEQYLNRLADLEEQVQKLDGTNDRATFGYIGDHLGWLENANQAGELIVAVRARYSHPNALVSISSTLLSRLASQQICDTQPIRQNVSGRLVRGNATTSANVNVELQNDPNQVHASIHLLGNIDSNTYIEQGKLQVFTQSLGAIEARRSVYANVGGLFANDPYVAANFQANLLGTTSSLNLVNRIASKKFAEARAGAEGQAARQAEAQLEEQFLEQTESPIQDGQERLAEALQNSIDKTSKVPSVFLRSTPTHILAVARKDTLTTLASPTAPADYGVNPEVSVRIHESLISNYLDKTFSGRTFTDSELAQEIEDVTGEPPAGLTGDPDEAGEPEPFSITFAQVRPIQFAFENQGFSIAVSGQRFSQGSNAINEPLNIILRFRIIQSGGKLKLVRNGPVDFSYPDPTQTTPKIVAFRSFLDSRLNRQIEQQDTEQELPDNLIPVDRVEALQDSPLAKELRLVQFRSENGWLYLGWNQAVNGMAGAWIYDMPAIWSEATIDQLDSTYTPVETE